MTPRAQVVEVARTWIKTPYHHQARLKGVGVDCVGVPIGVCRELGLVAPDFDVSGYSNVPDGKSLIRLASLHARPITMAEMQIGDMVAVGFDKDPQHFGILGDYRHAGFSIIHALGPGHPGEVVETRLMFSRAMYFVAAFALPGVE